MIEKALIIALTAVFWYVSTLDGMINNWVRRLTFNWKPWIKKPLFDCPVCSAFWVGLLILSVGGLPCQDWKEGLLILFTACGISAVLVFFIPREDEIEDDQDS